MTGEIEAAGELVTGGLIARAVEPHAGEEHGHAALCLNCGTALTGAFCHRCGQSGHVHRSLGAIGHEILHGVAHFEGKLWRTLPLLAWRPGKLTRRYIDGERARFVSPMAIFLFSIFTMFAVFQLLGISPQSSYGSDARVQRDIVEARQELQATRQGLEARRAPLLAGSAEAQAIERRIARIDTRIEGLDQGRIETGPIEADFTVRTGWHRLDKGILKALENPSLAAYKLQSNSYKFSWLLILLSIPFLWLLFAWRRQFHLYDHAVFVTYSIAFMSLLFIAATLLSAIGVPRALLGWSVAAIVPLHIYRQLKHAYGLNRASAIVRTIVLLFFSLIVLVLFLAIVLAMGTLG